MYLLKNFYSRENFTKENKKKDKKDILINLKVKKINYFIFLL